MEQEPLFRLSFAASTALQYVATVPVRMIWREEERRKERGIFERKEGRRGERERREEKGREERGEGEEGLKP